MPPSPSLPALSARRLRLGTRSSPLALWQARWVQSQLEAVHPGLEVELVQVRTRAESFPDRPIAEIGAGVFTRELDEALERGDIDAAVHSLKDVPSRLPEALCIAAVPERESPLDAFVSPRGIRLEVLPPGSRVGTGSPRRAAQILHRRPDLAVVPLRGNVETRLSKVRELGLAGTVLAHAGLKRLGKEGLVTHLVDPSFILPAVAQGAVGVCARCDDRAVLALLEPLEHSPSRVRVEAERAFLAHLRGGCQVPAGALATLDGAVLRLEAVVASSGGRHAVRDRLEGSPAGARALGVRLAEALLARGAREILRDLGVGGPGGRGEEGGP